MRILRIWVAYFMVCGAAWAQNDGVLEGVIKDADGGPLAGANVLAHSPELGMRRGATTDADGRYRIQSLSAGQYDVTVSFIGYKSKAKSSVLISQGIVSRENFVLESEVYMQGQIVVSASRRREKAIDAPAAVSVVESDDIANRAATSVSDFVKGLPGVDSAPTGLSQSNTVARGFNNVFSGAMLTLVDNRIASVPSLRLNANNFIPITDDDIERIEIVLGPGAALYGPNSANGVMHIISKSPFQSVGTSI